MEQFIAFFADVEPVLWWMMFSVAVVGNFAIRIFSLRVLRNVDIFSAYLAFLGGAAIIINTLSARPIPFLRISYMRILGVEAFYIVCALMGATGLLILLMLPFLYRQN